MEAALHLKVLCVEDDPAILELLGQVLETEGYDVALVASAEEGLERLRRESFELVISDYQLPGRSGIELFQQAQSRGWLGKAKGLLVTAASPLPHAGNLRVLKKPLDLDDLLECVSDLLVEARSRAVAQAKEVLSGKGASAERKPRAPGLTLTLYLSGPSPSSLKAVRNLNRLLARYPELPVQLTVHDLAREFPPSVESDRIAFTPTLVKQSPGDRAWFLGTLEQPGLLEELLQAEISRATVPTKEL